MDEANAIDLEALMREIRRYLDAVDAFRGAGFEPQWTREPRPPSILTTERSS
jgi:hypothetical protein